MAAQEHEIGGSGSVLTLSTGTKVLAKSLNEQKGGRDLWAYTNTGGGGDGWFAVQITGGSGDGPYSWVQSDFDPVSMTWAGSVPSNSGGNAYRMPSQNYQAPTIPVGQYALLKLVVVNVGSSGSVSGASITAKYYELTPWGGELRYTRKVYVGSVCDSGNIVNIYKRERWYARDLCIGPGAVGDAS